MHDSKVTIRARRLRTFTADAFTLLMDLNPPSPGTRTCPGHNAEVRGEASDGGDGRRPGIPVRARRHKPHRPRRKTRAPTADNAVMLTIFLKHDQSRPLRAQLQRQGYYKAFPPEGVEVGAGMMMGIGQVVTLRLPAPRLREVNRILENTAWGSYRTEFYPTYDYKAIGIAAHDKAQ